MTERQKKIFALMIRDFLASKDGANWLHQERLTDEQSAMLWDELNELEP
jgi:hypothetical protein